MILADISVKWFFDYEMDPDEQIYHERFVSGFESRMERFLNSCGVNSNYRVTFDLYYYPAIQKFYIHKIGLNEELLSSRLHDSHELKKYLISEIPDASNYDNWDICDDGY